jgi:hypothetical protein
MSREGRALAVSAERVAERARAIFTERVALERDLALAAPLAIETRPVAEALLEGLAHLRRVDVRAAELREALALASLLGRRAAVLGATPTAALAIAPALLEAASHEDPRALELADVVQAVCMEGYVAATEEAAEERAARRAADAIPVLEPAPRCFLIAPAGVQDAEQLERVLDELGRRLLERDARACVIEISRLADPDRERARRLFAIDATCKMLGVVCVFSGVGATWTSAAREAGLDLEHLRIAEDLPAALRIALDACGLELRPRAGLGEVLRRIVGR